MLILIGAAHKAVIALGLAGESRILDKFLAAAAALAGRLRHGVKGFGVSLGMEDVVKIGRDDGVLVVLLVC